LLQRNYESLIAPNDENTYATNHLEIHEAINEKLALADYSLSIAPFLNTINDGDSIGHEMAIEAALIFQISSHDENATEVFGSWDYLSHQVVASPFKPVDYIDKMDIFGYSYIPTQRPTIAKYLVIELKKGTVTEQDLFQLMKYVDWVKTEYSLGDYSMINAFLVGHAFEDACITELTEKVERNFIYGVRPSTAKVWKNVKLVRYSYNENDEKLDFEITADANLI
ncbi:MAG: hypothetical protein ABUL44_04910, partial [Flavobacterium sp.]